MKRLLVLLALVALAAGGASAAPATRGSLQKPGLLVARERSTVLFGLDGKPLAHLVGLRAPWFANANTARNAAFQQLAAILPDRVLLAGPAGRWYVLDPPGRLDEVASPRVGLPGGAEVVAHTGPKNEGVFQVDVTVERAGRQIVPAAAELRRISGNLAVGRATVIDLRTGDRWNVSPDCYAAGSEGRELLMFCGPAGPKRHVTLVAVSTNGSRRTLAGLPNSLYATAAHISPNGKYVVGMFSPGCGPSYGFVIPTAGGTARPLSGARRWSPAGPNSIALGWTADNRIVAIVQPSSSIVAEPRRGVYLIDPHTLRRTLAYPVADAWMMWNPAGA